MKSYTRTILYLFAVMATIGCASTEITKRESTIGTEKVAKPERIYVYPFAVTSADIPTWSASVGRYSAMPAPQTPERIEMGRSLGLIVAEKLVTEIQNMGLSALEGNQHTVPRINDILITGYFEAVEEGNTAKRLTLGFGSGAAKLTTVAEGYQMTSEGPRQLGSAQLQSGGSKMPGLFVPLAVLAATSNPIGILVAGTAKIAGEITGRNKIEGAAQQTAEAMADQLRIRFAKAGWIQ